MTLLDSRISQTKGSYYRYHVHDDVVRSVYRVVKKITETFRKDHNIVDIDGVRVLFDDGWGLVRASNTQPALVLRFEAMTEKRLLEIKELIESQLAKIQKEI